MTTNNRISNIVSSQVPFFVRSDHENFVKFLEAYYEYLEQTGKAVDRTKGLTTYFDVDRTVDEFTDHLYNTFINLIPDETVADKAIILKNAKDLYRAKGTEKSIQFLLRAIFGANVTNPDFYYPKADVLRASDGKWFIEKSLKISSIRVNGVANTVDSVVQNFVGKKVTGNTSGGTATVERVDSYYDNGNFVRELKLSNQTKDFISNEQLFTTFEENGVTKSLTANTFSGIISLVRLQNSGSLYKVGDKVVVESNTGSGAVIEVSAITTGNIRGLRVVNGGAGYQVNNAINFTSNTGNGATANVLTVLKDSSVHPNTYNVVGSIILLEANTPLNNSVFSNLNSSNITAVISDAMSYFTYGNTGPVLSALVLTSGNNYSESPVIGISSNNMIKSLGILGRIEINNGGMGYQIGDWITFTNVDGGHGYGANANVTNVNAVGSITSISFQANANTFAGGQGYDQNFLPIANVSSGNVSAFGANLKVSAILGFGADLSAISSSLGAIRELKIVSGGLGYETVPTLNLSSIGDGTAQANCQIVTGAFTYPGRYLNDDGFISGSNYLEDRDYYQPFSYVIRTNISIERYRKYLKDLLHPAGMKMFGEYLTVDDDMDNNVAFQRIDTVSKKFVTGSYRANGNGTATFIAIETARNLAAITNAFIEYVNVDPVYSNLVFKADASGSTTTGNLFTQVGVGSFSNLDAVVSNSTPTQINLVEYKSVKQTSNLILNTTFGSNSVNLVTYTAIGQTTNLEAKTTSTGNVVSLVTYVIDGNGSNLEIQTGTGTSNTLNIVQYTRVAKLSNVTVNTAAGGSTNTLSLITLEVANNNTTNLKANTGSGATVNAISLIQLENLANTTNLAVSTDQTEFTNQLNLLRFNYIGNSTNLVVSTGQADFVSEVTLQRFIDTRTVMIESTSNLSMNIVQPEIILLPEFVTATDGNLVQLLLTQVTSNLSVNTGSGNVISLVTFTTPANISNLTANTDSTGGTITLSAWKVNSNVFFANGYTLRVNGVNTVITSSSPTSRTVKVSPALGINLVANTITVYEQVWRNHELANSNVYFTTGDLIRVNGVNTTVTVSDQNTRFISVSPSVEAGLSNKKLEVYQKSYQNQWRANSNVALPNNASLTIRVNGRDYTLANSNPNSNAISISPPYFGNLISNTIYVVSYYDSAINNVSNIQVRTGQGTAGNNNTQIINFVQYTPVFNTTNLQVSTPNTPTIVSLRYSSNLSVNTGITPTNTVNLIAFSLVQNTSNLYYTTASGYPNTNTTNVISFNDRWANSNVYFGPDYILRVNGTNTIIVSANVESNTVTVSPFVEANLSNAVVTYERRYSAAQVQNSNVYFTSGYTIRINSIDYSVYSASPTSTTLVLSSNVAANTFNAGAFIVSRNSNSKSIIVNATRFFAVNGTSNLRANTTTSSNTITLNRPLNTSNVFIGTGYTLNIGNRTTVTVVGSSPTSNTITVSPALSSSLRSNTIRVISFIRDEWSSNSNVAFGGGYSINIGNNILVQNTSNLRVDTGSGASVNTINLSGWVSNSNVVIGNNYSLRINNTEVVIISSSPSSNVVRIDPGIAGNLLQSTIFVQSYYTGNVYNITAMNATNGMIMVDKELPLGISNNILKVEAYYKAVTPAQSNVALNINHDTYKVTINGQNTAVIISTDANSNVATLSHPIRANLTNATMTIDGRYVRVTPRTSNVNFAAAYTTNVGTNSVVLSGVDPDSSTIALKSEIPGRIIGNTLNILSYYTPANLRTSNVFVGNTYRLVLDNTVYTVLQSNPYSDKLTVSPFITGNYISNVLSVATYYRDQWTGNSNVTIKPGYRLNINNSTYIVTSLNYSNNVINITPGIPGNTFNATIVVEKFYRDEWAQNSNVAFANGYTLLIDGSQTVTVTNYSPQSNTITVTPAITGGRLSNSLNVISFYQSKPASVSNTPFKVGYRLNIGKTNTVTVTGISGNTITVTPAMSGAQTNSGILVVSYYQDQWIANSNIAFGNNHVATINGRNVIITSRGANSNQISVSVNVGSPLVNSPILIVGRYNDAWVANSNIAIKTGYRLNVSNLGIVNVTSAVANSSVIQISPSLAGNVLNNKINVEFYYQDQWIANSNVAFGNNYVLRVNNQNVTVITSYGSNSSTLTVAPALSYPETNSRIYLDSYYQSAWAQNSNSYFTVGDTLRLNTTNVVISTIERQIVTNTSNLTFSTSYVSNSNTVRTITLSGWAQNSNVAFINSSRYSLTVGSQNVSITSYRANSNTITVSPNVASNIVANTLVINLTTNTQLSKITLTTPVSGNSISNTFTVYSPIKLSNGIFSVTANSACTNGYYYIVSGTSVNANGTVYTSV